MPDRQPLASNQTQADELVGRPVESLNVELKTWLNPADDAHVAKLVRAILALRNRGGGFLIIGFNDKTLQPDPYSFPNEIEDTYHLDEIQALVSRYAHDAFQIEVRMGIRDGLPYPVVVVPEGVRTPVAVKRDLIDKTSGRPLLSIGEIFFRTLESNGTPSSARLAPSDLATLMEICFDNREADIGRFLRRQLGGGGAEALRALFGGEPIPSDADRLRARTHAVIERGRKAFAAAIQVSRPLPANEPLLQSGLTMHVGMAAEPTHPDALPTSEFMNRILSSNPRYTGWPIWLDARGFFKPEDRSRVEDGAWVTLIRGDSGEHVRIEYMRYDPRGEFYLRRVMQDDTTEKVQPFTAFDPLLMLYRVTECIAAGISILRGAGWNDDEKAGFAFVWTGLAGRQIKPWVNPLRFFGVGESNQSHTDVAQSYVEVGLDTPHLALAPAVGRVVAPLFASFNGYQPPAEMIEGAVRELVERRL